MAAKVAAHTIPPLQFTTTEKAALAAALVLFVVNQTLPQLATSSKWLSASVQLSATAVVITTVAYNHKKHQQHIQRANNLINRLGIQANGREKDTKVTTLEAEVESLTTQLTSLEEADLTLAQEKDTKITTLQAEVKRLEAELTSLTESAETLAQEKDPKVTTLEAEVESLTAQLASLKEQAETLANEKKLEIARLEIKVESLADEREAQAQRIGELEDKVAELNHHNAKHALESSKAKLDDQLKDHRIEELEAQVKELRDQLELLANSDADKSLSAGGSPLNTSAELHQEFISAESNLNDVIEGIHKELDKMFASEDENEASKALSHHNQLTEVENRIVGWVARIKTLLGNLEILEASKEPESSEEDDAWDNGAQE